MKNIYNKLSKLIELENKVLYEHQNVINTWTNSIDNKHLTSNEADKIYSPICGYYHKMHDSLYKDYYNTIHSLISNEEVEEIQKKINYNFMSVDFINELKNYI